MNEKTILTIIEKFNEAAIAELDLDDGTTHLVLRKDAAFYRPGMPIDGSTAVLAASAAPANAAAATAATEPPSQVHLSLPVSTSGNQTITSPIVATFYGAPKPESPPFVRPGSRVKAGDTLCILEAMKMMNHLEAEFDCEIVSILVSNGDMIEYGQALFEVKQL